MNGSDGSAGCDGRAKTATDASGTADREEAAGRQLESEGRLREAAAAFDRALAIAPRRKTAAEARARIALQLEGGEEAVEHCRRALTFHDADPELQLQMVGAAAAILGTSALPLVDEYLERHPASLPALEQLVEMRAQSGLGAAAADPFDSAISAEPKRADLWLAHARSLWRGQHHAAALAVVERARRHLGNNPALDLLEAQVALDAGDAPRAEACLVRHGNSGESGTARAQLLLQTGRAEEAASLLQALIGRCPNDAALWAMLSIAWRLTGDPRHAWLCDQPGLWQSLPMQLGDEELERIAEVLRRLHVARAQPLGQSVRGGTQTSGSLFARQEPEIARLREAVAAGVRDYLAGLPPFDLQHPLLRHRDGRLAFGPSWSVRLTEGGFHVPHVHPAGVLSSACYLSVPPAVEDNGDQEGWLELGRPPAELRIDLPPLAVLKPERGRLILFPSYLFHGTRAFSAGERLSVAFDVAAA